MVRKNLIVAAMALAALTAGCGAAPGAKSSPTPTSTAPTNAAPVAAPVAQGQAPAQQANPGQGQASAQPTAPTQSPSPAPPAVPATPQPVSVPFTTVARGYYSSHDERGAVLVTDDAGLKSLGIQSQQAVDFQKDALLVVFMGEQRTGGYSVEVTSVRQEGARLLVTVKQTRPAPGAIVTQALTQPYHAVRIPKPVAGTQVVVDWQ